ncbi:MAG: sulfite exporter TauE/SafE family protein [Flavobacteriales bacterium]
MEYVVVIALALFGSFLSFFSGFGLGTLLLPAFLLVFPIEIAITAQAMVHMLNNLFKLYLLGKFANWSVIKYFGLLSVVGAFLGSYLLKNIDAHQVGSYYIFGARKDITTLNLVIGILISIFALLETQKQFQNWRMPKILMPVGGLVSGFFGGLSGHQGALRSMFLMKAGLSKEAFMGTRVVLACMVDITRIAVYSSFAFTGIILDEYKLILVATLAAFSGAYAGNHFMKIKPMEWINNFILVSLLLFSAALILGWL